jgi:ubiquinone/menaquinone biosynthesis C-methylase UbiE
MYQQRERVLLSCLKIAFQGDVSDKKVLDIGCGSGGTLLPMLCYGFRPENCFGLDILEDRIETAKKRLPNITFACCSAENIPFQKETFDLVTMFTCLSSILDSAIRKQVCRAAEEMVKPGGWILIYDFTVNNPRNPDVKAVTYNQLKELFENCRCVKSKKLTLLPPLARIVGKYSYALCESMSWIPFLKTHRMTLFQK